MILSVTDFEIVFCTYFKNKKEFIYSHETYREYVMFCVESGSFSYGYSPLEKEKYVAKSGDIVLCFPNKTFYRKVITPLNFCMIKFIAENALTRCEAPVVLTDTARFLQNINMLKSSFFCDIKKSDHMTNHYCRDIVYQFFSVLQQKFTPISQIFDYINANYTANISISELANRIGYSTARLIDLFKEYYGYTPKAYISFLKLKRAQHLLKKSDMTVGEISAECGFSDALYFSRFFKSQCGMTPTEFKKLVKI